MKSVITENTRVPVKMWAPINEVEVHAVNQLKNIASLPFVFKHVAAMPDVHLGIGATVGSVVATKGAVIPAAVGVDIGCGMMALKLEIEPAKVIDKTRELRSAIEAAVPVGHLGNKSLTSSVEDWTGWATFSETSRGKFQEIKSRAMSQLGSLGGGNHFIELCTDTNGEIWVMLHSGSRNLGKTLAESHISGAKELMKRMFVTLPDPDLAYYVTGTDEYSSYMRDLMWAQDYAAENRREMMRRILEAIASVIGLDALPAFSNEVNCHHNYASYENHYGENVIVTRKGAVRARTGDMGIIPGSMGTRSYIVRGLGNQESFHSCSHGAGRRMSRSEAKRRFTVSDLETQTQGVDCRKDIDVVDEIPSAYKDIDQVMENQKDLVEVVAQLKQFMCIKG